MFDLLIQNSKIIDGSGVPWFKADIGIIEGKITSIGRLKDRKAKNIVEASDLVVCPGFIDIHTHSDLALLINGEAESKIRQGVTTEVIGNCGYSPAPVSKRNYDELKEELWDEYKLELAWSSFPEYLDKLRSSEISVNIVPLIGHGALRASVMGYDARQPTEAELDMMKDILQEAMEAGAAGFSSGLIYPPSSYAMVDELIELAKAAAELGGIYTTHMRYEGEKLLTGVREAIRVGEMSGIPVQISHHKVTDRKNWGLVSTTLEMMEKARDRGVDVSCDLYPYLATATELTSTIPDWAHEGGLQVLLKRIEESGTREKILKELVKTQEPQGWDNIHISTVYRKENKPFEGMDIKSISKEMKLRPEEVVLEITKKEKGRANMIRFAMCEEDLKTVLASRLSMIGSDAGSKADYGMLSQGKPHPRSFGTFPRVLGKFCREEKVINLEQAVHKMTGLPAWRLGLSTKGLIREGMDADLTIFDPKKIIDKASYSDPFQYPEGIEKVIVAGQIVVDKNQHTGIKAGRVIS